MKQKWFPIGLVLFLGLAAGACWIQRFSWDLPITLWLQSLTPPGFERLMVWVSIPGNGSWQPYVMVLAVSIAFLLAGKKLEAGCSAMSAGGGALLSSLFKWIVGRPRPNIDLVKVWTIIGNQSFPSGHVVNYVTFYGFLFCLVSWRIPNRLLRALLQLLLGTLILLVGPSRIYLGAHWSSDVIGGYLLGSLWLWRSIQVYKRYQHAQATVDTQEAAL